MTLSTHFLSYFLPNIQLNIGKKYLKTAKIIDESLILAIVLRNYSTKPSYTCMQNNQTFVFTRRYFWGIRTFIWKPHIICAVILVNPCFIHVHDIIPCFSKRFDLSQIITPIIDNRHLIVRYSR